MSEREDDFRIRPGRPKDHGASGKAGKRFVNQVMRAAKQAGHTGEGFGPGRSRSGGRFGRGQARPLRSLRGPGSRRVIVKARVVRHTGARFRSAPLARHIAYLGREGVTRDGGPAGMFDSRSDRADTEAFAERCENDRHHFRFIVSPEDAGELQNLRTFTRELMTDAERDLGTRLDWVAIDHWNTDNPHVHVLVRGIAEDGQDLVISRDYIKEGLRDRAEQRATLELGPRTRLEIDAALARDVTAERWTGLDRKLQRLADDGGAVDLRPGMAEPNRRDEALLRGRAQKLERMGLAEAVGPAQWTLKPGLETSLRDLSIRGDIIKTMHRAMSAEGRAPDPATFALHGNDVADPIVGRLVERGLHDELAGSAYAVVDGIDGRSHHLRFDDLEMTGDAKPGAIVELRRWQDAKGWDRLSLATRSDLSLGEQVAAPGATWLDRQLVSRTPVTLAGGFGESVRDAMAARADHLADQGLARRQAQRIVFARDLLDTLAKREMEDATRLIGARTGLAHRPSAPGEHVAGTYRERVTLATGRFAMIDDGLGFQLVPWRPALDAHLGRHLSGTMTAAGGVDWNLGRSRSLGL